MPVRPYAPLTPQTNTEEIELSVRVSHGSGAWVELNDRALMRVAEGSFGEEAVTLRRVVATNPFLEGEDTVQALRGNIVRPLNIWVTAHDHYELATTLEQLKSVFLQLRFQVVRTVENVSETINCFASEYSVTTDRPLLHARMAQLKVQLVCDPNPSFAEEI